MSRPLPSIPVSSDSSVGEAKAKVAAVVRKKVKYLLNNMLKTDLVIMLWTFSILIVSC